MSLYYIYVKTECITIVYYVIQLFFHYIYIYTSFLIEISSRMVYTENRDVLHFKREHSLSKEPPEMDLLVINISTKLKERNDNYAGITGFDQCNSRKIGFYEY